MSEFPIVHTSSTNNDQRSIIDSRREIKLKKDNSKEPFQNKIKITMKRFLGIFILRILEGIKVLNEKASSISRNSAVFSVSITRQ